MLNLSLDVPRNGRGPSLLVRLVALLVVLAVGGTAGFFIGRGSERRAAAAAASRAGGAQPATAPVAAAPSAAQATAPQPSAAAPSAAGPAAPAPSAAGPAAPAPAAPQAPGAVAASGPVAVPSVPGTPPAAATPIRRVSAVLRGALEESIAAAMAPEDRGYAEELTQVVNRLLVWQLQVAREGMKGDRFEVLWEPPPVVAPSGGLVAGMPLSKEPIVHAVRYGSQKLGREIAAYRFQPEGAKWARYYQPDGNELEERLVDSPIAEYEQITSLLRDGRKHKGVDFKTPVGTPVLAPFDGTIVKRNWNWRYNGNSLEIVDAKSGRHAIFLHLDVIPKDVAVGRTVKKGQQIASSGNTGRSFAPHLHYQLEDASGRVLDPFAIHPVKRAALEASHRAAFDAARQRLDPLMASAAR